MIRHGWDDLPAKVRSTIEQRCGAIDSVITPSAGRNSDLSAALYPSSGQVFFVKGALEGTDRARMHRHESRVGPFLPPEAPLLLWHEETERWLINGYEHVSGHYADLSPDSADLERVRDAVTRIGHHLTPCPLDVPSLAQQWQRLAAWRRLERDYPEALGVWERQHLSSFIQAELDGCEWIKGDTLVHTDLHPLNIIIDRNGRVRVIDWAWSRRAAAWVDTAILVVRLIAEGHTAEEAEEWAAESPAWSKVPEEAVTAFAITLLGVWTYTGTRSQASHVEPLTHAARTWTRSRITAWKQRRSNK